MSTWKKINVVRGRIMHSLTKNIGNGTTGQNQKPIKKTDIKKVLICRPNHRLGNLLLMTPLIQEIIATFPDCKIDLFVKGNLAPILYETYPQIDKIIKLPKKPWSHLPTYGMKWLAIKTKHYDLAINADKGSSSGRLSTQFSRGTHKVFGDISEAVQLKHLDHEHIAKYPIYSLRELLAHSGIVPSDDRIPSLDLKLTPAELLEGKKTLMDIVQNDKKTICIFTFATGNKCYSEAWWLEFYESLMAKFQDYNIIEMLPIENVSQIGFKAPTFYSKDIRHMTAIFANCELFIGADSGIMHLASAAQTTTVGLFSVTNPDIYRPFHNGSVAIKTSTTDIAGCVSIVDGLLK
jgi:ADP-heptose:LPS heptosyltransferase